MKREIKFRGQTKNKKNWVYGFLVNSSVSVIHKWPGPGHFILDAEVLTESVGQFSGLKDKNGTEIYEGDIVRTDFKNDGSHDSIQVIEFYEGAFGSRNKDDHFRIPALFSGRATEGMNTNYFEVIGNIYENSELLS